MDIVFASISMIRFDFLFLGGCSFNPSFPRETAIENNVDFNIEVGRLFGNRVINN